MIPITAPNQVFKSKPIPGSTSKATLVYKGCFTKAYGPLVISLFWGTLVTINRTDHIQMVSPGSNRRRAITFKKVGGPPTLKNDGFFLLRIAPRSKNGNVNSPILSPLPTSAFTFIRLPRSASLHAATLCSRSHLLWDFGQTPHPHVVFDTQQLQPKAPPWDQERLCSCRIEQFWLNQSIALPMPGERAAACCQHIAIPVHASAVGQR